jgi:hypothetical protein
MTFEELDEEVAWICEDVPLDFRSLGESLSDADRDTLAKLVWAAYRKGIDAGLSED